MREKSILILFGVVVAFASFVRSTTPSAAVEINLGLHEIEYITLMQLYNDLSKRFATIL